MQEDHLGQVVGHGSCCVAASHQSQQNVQVVTDRTLLYMSYGRSLSLCSHCFSWIHSWSGTLTPSHCYPCTLHSPTLHTCTPPLTLSPHTSLHLTGSLTLSLCTLDTHVPLLLIHPPLPPSHFTPTLPHTHPKVSPEYSHELSHHFHYLIVRVGVVGEPRCLADCDDGDVHPPGANNTSAACFVKHVTCCRGSLIPRLPRSGVWTLCMSTVKGRKGVERP